MEMRLELTLTEPMLGTAPANPEIYSEFIEARRPRAMEADDETATLPLDDEIAKGTTVFHKQDGDPFIYDYQIKGFFKDACGMLRRVNATESKKCKAYKKEIDGLIFGAPRRIMLALPDGAGLDICERPLRAQTMQGERVSLARSERAPVDTKLVFTLTLLNDSMEGLVVEWLNYGKLRGLGQWRNSGAGRFTWRRMDA